MSVLVLAFAGAVVLVAPWLWGMAAEAERAADDGLPQRPDEVLAAALAAATLVGLVWFAAVLVLEALAEVPGAVGRGARAVADVVTPGVLRRAAGALLGVGVVAGLAPGASVADPTAGLRVVTAAAGVCAPSPSPSSPDRPPGARSARPVPLPDPGWAPPSAPAAAPERPWLPPPPVVRPQPDVRVLVPAPRRPTPDDEPGVVVHRGDSLWSLAARHLGADASDAEIARAWPRWYEANRSVIGEDPDLLRPGQVLRPPEPVAS